MWEQLLIHYMNLKYFKTAVESSRKKPHNNINWKHCNPSYLLKLLKPHIQ